MKNKKYKKHIFSCMLVGVMLISFSACGKSDDGETISRQTTGTTNYNVNSEKTDTSSDNANVENNTVDGESKILIAYFTVAENSGVDVSSSASYTTINGKPVGRVRAVADMIQAQTGGDLFSIQTSTVYPDDGGKLIDQAADEQDVDFRPELTSHIENINDYQVIFVGFPNWWYDMPMVMYSFFEEYDFSGKTIIPFNVHNGSRFSDTINTIQKLEPNATVIKDGFTVSERNVADAQEDVSAWLNNLEY